MPAPVHIRAHTHTENVGASNYYESMGHLKVGFASFPRKDSQVASQLDNKTQDPESEDTLKLTSVLEAGRAGGMWWKTSIGTLQ